MINFIRLSNLIKNVPIGNKILFIVLFITNMALLIASISAILYDRITEKQSLIQELNVLTRIIGQRSTAALVFEDAQLANENLQSLSEKNIILTACIYNSDNQLFSQYIKNTRNNFKCELNTQDLNSGFIKDRYHLHQKINLDNSHIGSISILASLGEINKRFLNYVIFIAMMFMVSIFIAFLFAVKLRKYITDPIANLANASINIYQNNDYSIRVKKTANDELGRLVESFNKMLGVIEQRDRDLLKSKDNLEELVKERTDKLKKTQNELVRSERLATLGQLTATVSHELRNPLGTIRTSAFTLSNKLESKEPKITKILDRIERNIIRCDNIITELLDYTRIRALNHELTNLSSWLKTVIVDILIPDHIKLTLDLDESINVNIDRSLLRRVIINIIENSCQSIDENSEQSNTVKLECLENEARVEIIISDTGTGIPDDVFPHIFEPLYSTTGFGVGLGLPIVKQIMEQHGGGVDIISKNNNGTKVILWLPASLNFNKELAS